jgi:hypothetical protein
MELGKTAFQRTPGMSALGQKQTSRDVRRMSAFTPESGHGTAGIEDNICLRVYESTPQVRPKK